MGEIGSGRITFLCSFSFFGGVERELEWGGLEWTNDVMLDE